MSQFVVKTQELMETLTQETFSQLQTNEILKFNLSAEESLFLRFNGNKVRQNTLVTQRQLKLELQSHQRVSTATVSLAGEPLQDRAKLQQALNYLRQEVQLLEEDPFIAPLGAATQSYQYHQSQNPPPENIADLIHQAGVGMDLTGLWASGPQILASYNSLGAKHFFAADNFFFDYSLFHGEKAAKGSYSDRNFSLENMKQNILATHRNLEALMLPTQEISKGNYRVYLAPAALAEICQLLSWGALSQDSFQRGGSPLNLLGRGEKSFSPLLSVRENFALGLHPQFNSLGEVSAEQVPLIEQGKLSQFLTSSRTAKEFQLTANAAESSESARSLEIEGGSLKATMALEALGTGVYLSNLHYLNWSDRTQARLTGMTRYACLWVENGQIKGPIKDMRFDVSLYDIWGAGLEAICAERSVVPAVGTYYAREIGGQFLPGMLIGNFTFTL